MQIKNIIKKQVEFETWRIIQVKTIIIIIIIIIISLEFFTSALADGFFTGDWVIASPLKSPGLFSVFWPFSIKLLFGWSPLGNHPNNRIIIILNTIGITVTFMFHGGQPEQQSPQFCKFSIFLLII